MSLVVDASTVGAFVLPDEQPAAAIKARQHIIEHGAIAPTLFWYEVRNLLLINEQRGRFSRRQADEALAQVVAMPIELVTPDDEDALDCARRHRLTLYDASYLSLAIRERVSLATLDNALIKAALAEGVSVLT